MRIRYRTNARFVFRVLTLLSFSIFGLTLITCTVPEPPEPPEPRPEPYQVAEGVMLIDRWGKEKTDHTLVEGADFTGMGGTKTLVLLGDIAADALGDVYVTGNDSVQKFTADGKLLWERNHPNVRRLAVGHSAVYIADDENRVVKVWSNDGELSENWADIRLFVRDIAADEAGNVYIGGGSLLSKFTANGEPVMTRNMGVFSITNVGVDGLGNIFVQVIRLTDQQKMEVQVHIFSSDGELVRTWDVSSHPFTMNLSNQSQGGVGFAVDRSGATYIGSDGRVRMFTSHGELLREWPISPSERDQSAGGRWDRALGIDVSDSGNLYAQDGRRVQVFSVDVTSP